MPGMRGREMTDDAHCLCGSPADDEETRTCRPCREDRHAGVLEDEREERREER